MGSTDTGVLVAGAGPTGLLLAGDLAAAGVPVTVLERRDHESDLSGAFAVHARTLEILDARGLAEDLIATGRQVGTLEVFGAISLDLSRLPSRYPFLLATPQHATERILRERAVSAGAQVIDGAEVVGLDQDSDRVEVQLRSADGTRSTRRAAYLVGTGSAFHSVGQQVPRYREGRVFLAGDAAHGPSPAGGHGMNTGLQDAANLSWKLAAVLHGWGDDRLLDSYHAERYPVGKWVLEMSERLLRPLLPDSAEMRRTVTLLGGAAAHVRPFADKVARAISGIAIGYEAGSGNHPLAGRRMPDVPVTSGDAARLYEVLRRGHFVLLTAGEVPRAVRGMGGRVEIADRDWAHPRLILVRPDGYIAWACDHSDPNRRDRELEEALSRWCGGSATVQAAA